MQMQRQFLFLNEQIILLDQSLNNAYVPLLFLNGEEHCPVSYTHTDAETFD